MQCFSISSKDIRDNIYIPKYYDADLASELEALASTHKCYVLGDLIDSGVIEVKTGDEIGKMAYGTGDIPFVRTTDITNWEIKTVPKQGVSEEIYEKYGAKQDVQPGDILMVKDGSYLIGVTCMIHPMDLPLLYQSHILKFRVIDESVIDANLFFALLNTPLVQRQIRSFQFTADIIDTIGQRYREIKLFIPDASDVDGIVDSVRGMQENRAKSRLVVKQFPKLMEDSLASGNQSAFDDFNSLSSEDAQRVLISDTSTLEFGKTTFFKTRSDQISNRIFIPKYYDPSIDEELEKLSTYCDIVSIQELVDSGELQLSTGDEIGKMAYGTGDIPFVRTTDFSNWEIKHNTKQKVSREIYEEYREKEDVRAGDILLVRDGSYLIGSSCIITQEDTEMLFCGGLIKIRVNVSARLTSALLFALLNSYIVKRQMRSKQFTRDIIDTMGNRFPEVKLPIPKEECFRSAIAQQVVDVVQLRTQARERMVELTNGIY